MAALSFSGTTLPTTASESMKQWPAWDLSSSPSWRLLTSSSCWP
jgi:hypothetical protein